MKKVVVALAMAALSCSAGSAFAQKKQLVIVVKGLDNPFFEAIHQCSENPIPSPWRSRLRTRR